MEVIPPDTRFAVRWSNVPCKCSVDVTNRACWTPSPCLSRSCSSHRLGWGEVDLLHSVPGKQNQSSSAMQQQSRSITLDGASKRRCAFVRGSSSRPRVTARSSRLPVVAGGKVYLDPVQSEATAFAPATVANLGPGFDWLGCAVEVGDAAAQQQRQLCCEGFKAAVCYMLKSSPPP